MNMLENKDCSFTHIPWGGGCDFVAASIPRFWSSRCVSVALVCGTGTGTANSTPPPLTRVHSVPMEAAAHGMIKAENNACISWQHPEQRWEQGKSCWTTWTSTMSVTGRGLWWEMGYQPGQNLTCNWLVVPVWREYKKSPKKVKMPERKKSDQ